MLAQKASDFHVGSGSCLSSYIRKADATFPASVIVRNRGSLTIWFTPDLPVRQ